VESNWRVTADLGDLAAAGNEIEALVEHEVPDDVRGRLGDRAEVSSHQTQIFVYTATARAAREAEQCVRDCLARHDLTAAVTVDHWDELAEVWRDPAGSDPAPDAAEDHRTAAERARSLETGLAMWEVRVELSSHHDTEALAAMLTAEGGSVVRRRKFLVAGANSEADARELAERIRGYAPADASIRVEPGGGGIRYAGGGSGIPPAPM